MRKFYTSSFTVLICFAFLLPSCFQHERAYKSKAEKAGIEDEESERPDRPDLAEAFEIERTKDPALGYVPKSRLIEAFQQVKSARLITDDALGALTGIVWNERGPSNVGGRTRSILVDKNDPTGNTIWAGSVGGGLWKATNFTSGTYAWQPINDLFPNLAVTTIAQNPVNTNTLYFGTGEGYGNSDALQGAGVWKSTNGGVTWTLLTATNVASPASIFSFVQKIVVKQVGGTEYLFVATRNGGIQRSTDGGLTFTQVNTGATTLRAADLDIAANGDIWAGMGLSGGGNDGVYRSTDNGTTWVKSTVGLPVSGFGRVEIAVAPGSAGVVYVTLQNSSGSAALGIYKTVDFGATWAAVTNANGGAWASSQAWYDMAIAVDPDDANHVIIGGLDTYSTLDGGVTWTAMSSWFGGPPQYVHADHHELKFFKTASNQTFLYFGNDGGVFLSMNANNTQTVPAVQEKNTGYNVTQFYHGSLGPVPGSNQFIAGAQDNGTQYFTAPGINATAEVTGGDGAYSHIDDDNPNVQISQYVYNNYWVTNDNWATYSTLSVGNSVGRFINPSAYDSRTNTLYGAYNSTNFSIITNVGTTNNISTKAITGLGATASALTVSPNTIARVFMGTSGGRILKVDNANGATPVATNITAVVPVNGYISEIAVQEGDDNHIIYCASNYGINSIWETTNGGTTWTSIEGNFTQDVPVRSIMFSPANPDQAFIGTDIGVYSTDDLNGNSTSWGETNDGLARVSVQHLEYRRGSGTLMAVSHGRGVFTSTSLENPAVYFANSSPAFAETSTGTNGCRKYTDVNIPVTLSLNPSAPAQVTVSVNAALSTASAAQDYDIITPMPLTFSTASTQNVTLRIYDDAAVELPESLALEISIVNPGTTNAKKGAGYLNFISIADNDKSATVGGADQVIFSENWESGAGTWSGFGGGTAAAPNVWGIFGNCSNTISNQTAIIYNQPANTCGYDNAKPTTAVIYQTINATGKNNLRVEFDWIGYGEIGYDQGEVVFDTSGNVTPTWRVLSTATALSGSFVLQHKVAVLPSQLSNRSFRIGFRWVNDDNTGTNPPFAVDNINVISTLPAVIQLAADPLTVSTHYVGPLETVPFYDNSGKIIATLKNNNNVNLGCVKMEVDRAGGAANVPFWSPDPATFLCSKTYLVTAPDAPASGLSYDITLYYTAAEINTWTTQSGNPVGAARVVKISGHSIAEVTPSNPLASSVTVASSVTQSPYNITDYSFTSTFTSFSGFGLGAPASSPVPVTLVDFRGELKADHALLSWATSSEANNKGFYLERSFDGNNFKAVGFIDGHGTTALPHLYNYKDYDMSKTVIYYRLKQVDYDGRFTLSNIVRLAITKDIMVKVYPNPFNRSVKVLFGETVNDAVAKLVGANGAVVFTGRISVNGASSVTIDFGNVVLPKGNYVLSLQYNGKMKQVKLLKE